MLFLFFFFNDTATTEIYTLSLHDALPIYLRSLRSILMSPLALVYEAGAEQVRRLLRSEEHTSELQSHSDLVCRLLLEKKKEQNAVSAYPSYLAPGAGRLGECDLLRPVPNV